VVREEQHLSCGAKRRQNLERHGASCIVEMHQNIVRDERKRLCRRAVALQSCQSDAEKSLDRLDGFDAGATTMRSRR
jgi:hypothetical protein